MNKAQIKQIAYFMGKLLGVLGLVFVFYKLSQEYTWSSFIDKFSLFTDIIIPLILLNLLSTIIGIYAWHIMLLHYAKKPFQYVVSYYYFAKTEISKYLPGNIFHFVGRQALASKIGLSQMQMAKISLLFIFLLLSGTIFASLLFAIMSSSIPMYMNALMFVVLIGVVVVSTITYPSFPILKKIKMNLALTISIALQGIMLGLIIVYQIEEFSADLFFKCISIYIISWLIGFVTPGASGGLGVREGSFITISTYLNMTISSEIIIFSVLLIRLINIMVDILIYISTLTLTNRINNRL